MRHIVILVAIIGCSKPPPLARSSAETLLKAELARKSLGVSLRAENCSPGCNDGDCVTSRQLAAAGLVSLGPCEASGAQYGISATPTEEGRKSCLYEKCQMLETSRVELVAVNWPSQGLDREPIEMTFAARWTPTEVGRALGATDKDAGPFDLTKCHFYRRGESWYLSWPGTPEHGSHPPF